MPGYEFDVWYGMLFPAGTPPAIVNKVAADIARLAKQPALRERFAAGGMEAMSTTPQQFAQTIRTEAAKWKKVVEAANIRVQ